MVRADAILMGAVILAGWWLDIFFLQGAGRITVKANTALAMMLCGISLVLVGTRSAPMRVFSIVPAVVVAALAALTLSEHLVGWNLGIDELMFPERPGAAATASPGRMGPNAAISLTLAGIALVSLNLQSVRAVTRAQIAAFLVMVLATIALVGYLYGAQELYSISKYSGIAWPTAVTLFLIGSGILAARRDVGPMAALVSEGPGGMTARRLLLPALVLPVVLGFLRLEGEHAGLYDTPLGVAFFAVSLAVVFTIAVWRTAIRLDESERAREAALLERDELLVRERAAREQAERASRLKDEFLATMSHELRTPLNTLIGWSDMLRADVVQDDRRSHAAEVIARNGQLLASLVEDLLDVSHLATGHLPLDFEPVDLQQLVQASTEAVAAEANAKEIRLTCSPAGAPAVVNGDMRRMRQIVGNLLSNALKFTPPGGAIEVLLEAAPSSVSLVVRDNGLGIEPEFLPYVFERFRQGDGTTTREHGGLGLGLSIVRDLAELQGGRVEAHSAGPNHGATFRVTFPLLVESAASAT
jgi:signal transduction histidine kinase